MKKYFVALLLSAIVFGMVFTVGTPCAFAIKQFKDQFEAKYVKTDSDNPVEKHFADSVAEAKCNVCHEGKSKKDRNVYGTALSVLLDRKEDKENVEKIKEALATVEEMASDPTKEKAPKFKDLIAQGKLPAGEPK